MLIQSNKFVEPFSAKIAAVIIPIPRSRGGDVGGNLCIYIKFLYQACNQKPAMTSATFNHNKRPYESVYGYTRGFKITQRTKGQEKNEAIRILKKLTDNNLS